MTKFLEYRVDAKKIHRMRYFNSISVRFPVTSVINTHPINSYSKFLFEPLGPARNPVKKP